jgi:hypothetical protein
MKWDDGKSKDRASKGLVDSHGRVADAANAQVFMSRRKQHRLSTDKPKWPLTKLKQLPPPMRAKVMEILRAHTSRDAGGIVAEAVGFACPTGALRRFFHWHEKQEARVNQKKEGGDGQDTRPPIKSFSDFLTKCARVPSGRGEYCQYSFKDREPLIEVVNTIDYVLGSNDGTVKPDATISICGGAQFGKTATELNLGAYCTGVVWLNWGFYLPDRDLVEGMVDTKFRPDILDQIDWFARMTQLGKTVNKSGKSVNRKGAFSVTNGQQRSHGMILGLNKIPTSYTFDVATLDEVDDIKPAREKFVRGRMTASGVRLLVKIGTQRVAGRGQHKAWKEGSQGILLHKCPNQECGHQQNLEENWPRVCRVALTGERQLADPFLTYTGDFRNHDTGSTIALHTPGKPYYLACIRCGTPLDRTENGFEWKHLREERRELRHWSFRISQFAIAAIDLSQIVAEWVRAVADPEAMATFLCDRKAMPESTAQKLTVEILERARRVGEAPLFLEHRTANTEHRTPNEAWSMDAPSAHFDSHGRDARATVPAFAGLDTGRRCWFFARAVHAADVKRVLHVEQIALGNLVDRATQLFHSLGVRALFIDQAPATDEARTLALRLNGLEGLDQWPAVPKDKSGFISLPGGLRWNGASRSWENLRCAVVAFTKRRLGAGISHGFDIFEKGSQTMFVPLIEANRFETIDRVVREFLTPAENVSEVIFAPGQQSYVRLTPSMILPPKGRGAPIIHETLDEHLLAGSERAELRDGSVGDYVDGCENHFLLADAYSGLAELEAGGRHAHAPEPIQVFENTRRSQIVSSRGARRVEG